ncbi:hypothetical protein, partial [Ottowia beijingensis]|uniref:hypothetical protein n=1 Tax=Ottowia beijingensis TaxID=1207057 RepID=UPI002FDA073B
PRTLDRGQARSHTADAIRTASDSHSRSKLQHLVIPAQSLPRTAIRGRNPDGVCGKTWIRAFAAMTVMNALNWKWNDTAGGSSTSIC